MRRLLRPGGRMAFITIFVTPGLSPSARRRAHRSGPRAVATRCDHRRLLRSAGFADVEETDLTPEFLITSRAWSAENTAHADELAALVPPGAFEERQRERCTQLVAVEDGLLKRALFSATRPLRLRARPSLGLAGAGFGREA